MNMSARDVMTLQSLRSVPLFSSLDDDAARALRDLLEVRDTSAGTELFHQGDAGDLMYLIEGGRVRIHLEDAYGQEVTLAELGDGDFFGEMVILDDKPRSADATVIEDARLVVLTRDDFKSFVRSNPDVALSMLSAITNRLRQTDKLLSQRVSRNVNEEDAARKTASDVLADAVSSFSGSWKFISVFAVMMTIWILVNTLLLRNQGFDPYPYSFFDVINGVIALLLTSFVLISQNRQAEKDRLRADVDYRINLKNELALTEVLRRLDVLESERLPILFEEQNARLVANTDAERKESRPDS